MQNNFNNDNDTHCAREQ